MAYSNAARMIHSEPLRVMSLREIARFVVAILNGAKFFEAFLSISPFVPNRVELDPCVEAFGVFAKHDDVDILFEVQGISLGIPCRAEAIVGDQTLAHADDRRAVHQSLAFEIRSKFFSRHP